MLYSNPGKYLSLVAKHSSYWDVECRKGEAEQGDFTKYELRTVDLSYFAWH